MEIEVIPTREGWRDAAVGTWSAYSGEFLYDRHERLHVIS